MKNNRCIPSHIPIHAIRTATAVLMAFFCCGLNSAPAATVTSVQFPQYYGNPVSPMNADNYTGGVVSVQYWNVADTNTGTSPASNASLIMSSGSALGSSILVNSNDVNTAISFNFSGYVQNDHTSNSFPVAISSWEGGQADADIAAGTSFSETSAPVTLSLSGLDPTHTYNLIVYLGSPWWSGASSASVSAAGTTYYILTSNSLGAWTQVTSTTSGSPTTGNYVVFNNLTGSSSQTVTVTGAYVGLGGFQVVDQGVVSSGYTLSVVNGTGGGSYAAGTVVTVEANTPATGYQFAGWTGATSALANPSEEETTLTMPSSATSITATYSAISAIGLTVNSGSGSGSYLPGTVVTVTANAPSSGYQFTGWTGAGATALGSLTSASTTLTMPASATSITANYALTTATYPLTVTNGSGGGSYAAGTSVTITASTPASGYVFAGWTGTLAALSALFDPAFATTTVTMPAAPVSVTAGYTSTTTTYSLTVNGGSGSGNYVPGTVVTVSASGSPFLRWLGPTAALALWNPDSATTKITMPPVATVITASYGSTAQTYTVTVNGGSGGGSYAAGTVLTVTANTPTSGTNFTGWTGTAGVLANPAFSTTTLTVPASAVSITANYAATTSSNALTVTSGSGSGTYAPGTAVTVTANPPATGYQFAGWTGSTSYLANAAAPSTTFNMPSATASITATYTAISGTGTLVLAVGLERIVPGYNGPAIRIQRPSDNTQEDIGFAAGSNLLNTAAVTAFIGQGEGYITTLYDQTGGGNNVTTPLPTSTSTMPTISMIDPTTFTIDGNLNPTARDLEEQNASGLDNLGYFIMPAGVSVNKSQMSAFIACSPDYSGGITPMALYQIGNPATDAIDLTSSPSGLEGLTHNSSVTFSNNNVIERSQPTVIGLVTSPGLVPTLYLDGVGYSSRGATPASVTCSGGNIMGGSGQYDLLGFALYSGAVSPAAAESISSAMLPRTVPACNIVADGDSITQGTGSIFGYNMVHYLALLLNDTADITDIAIYGTTAPSAVGHASSPTIGDSADGMIYNPSCATNIYYVDIGTNDLHEGATGTATWGFVQQALQDAKALGYTTIVTTVMHETGESLASGTQVNIFNSYVRAAAGQYYVNGVVDYEADARLGNTANYNPAYTADGTHPNDAGYQVMASIAAPVFNQFIGDPYSQWSTTYYASDPANAADGASPLGDGVPNLLKYLCDINPTVPMSANARAALPVGGLTSISGSSYLTLSFRQNRQETGITVNVQTSSDLQTWQTVTPNNILTTGTDPVTGDPLMQYQVEVNTSGTSKEFIRLNLVNP